MKPEHSEEYRILGIKIATYRKMRGYTQEELAEMVDLNVSFLGAVEAQGVNRTVSLDSLFDIAKALDVPAYKFLYNDLED